MERFDINNVGTSKIVLNHNTISFPTRYLELYFLDYLIDNDINYIVNKDITTISYDNDKVKTLFDDLQLLQISATHAQHWYDDLSYLTFKSILIELDKDDIAILLDPMKVEDKLIDKINSFDIPFDYVFVRLNSLSPKNDNKINNNKNLAISIIDLIRQSQRCTDTLKLNWPHYLMLRQWIDINPQSEFRCFIYQNRLTAISQYHCYDKYNYINKNIIKNRIIQFYKDNYDKFIYEDCIVDLIVTNSDVTIVEFNSFASGISGSALYNWDLDSNILFNTNSNVDIRVNL